ncbi:DUF378 domain-containing protein [Pannonibacter phragmitetus]|uniref:DUF378 domain-containing protein n=1 Tax=Pannonibacter phragmitetus TaxID=121719 RepID=UPI000E660C04|nr:DUF378 domain-containing protein [Pannonibacter phragmitetus]
MRPQTSLDWIAFVLVIIGALAWGFFVFDVNILDLLLEAVWDPLDNVAFALIALAGLYWLVRALVRKPV